MIKIKNQLDTFINATKIFSGGIKMNFGQLGVQQSISKGLIAQNEELHHETSTTEANL